MTHLSDAQAKNRKEVESKLNQHIQKARKVFEEYEKKTRQSLAQSYQRQEQQLQAVEQKISENLDELCNNDICLQSLGVHEDCFLIYMTQTIEDLYSKQVNFSPKIENLDEVMITLKLEDDTQQKLHETLHTSHELAFDTIRE
jgi:exonuclease VII large subunit